jgi:hypothetical protein
VVDAGRYQLDGRASELPIVVLAAAAETGPGAPLTVSADIAIAGRDGSSAAGIALDDGAGTRLLAMVSADGQVSLLRDSIVELVELGSGSIEPPWGPFRLQLEVDGDGTAVSVDDAPIVKATTTFEPVGVGISVWASGQTRVEVDNYEVWTAALH